MSSRRLLFSYCIIGNVCTQASNEKQCINRVYPHGPLFADDCPHWIRMLPRTLTLLCDHSPLYDSPLTQRNSPIPWISLWKNSPVNRSPFLKSIPPWRDKENHANKFTVSVMQRNLLTTTEHLITLYIIYLKKAKPIITAKWVLRASFPDELQVHYVLEMKYLNRLSEIIKLH